MPASKVLKTGADVLKTFESFSSSVWADETENTHGKKGKKDDKRKKKIAQEEEEEVIKEEKVIKRG